MSMSFPIEVMQDGQIEMLCEQYRKEKKQRLREFRRIKRVFLINMGEGKAFLIDALPFRIPFLMFFSSKGVKRLFPLMLSCSQDCNNDSDCCYCCNTNPDYPSRSIFFPCMIGSICWLKSRLFCRLMCR